MISGEFTALSKICKDHHPNIIQMNYKGQIEEKTYISFELAENGSLYNYIINQDILTDEVARLLF